jgi:hypothetical protein
MYHISFYVPESHAEEVKQGMFAAGAGTIGNYDRCSFEIRGVGQFRPLTGSSPFLGTPGDLERVSELKIEMVCEKNALTASIAALRQLHPYETPAYCVIEALDF